MVGMSGSAADRVAEVIPSARNFPARTCGTVNDMLLVANGFGRDALQPRYPLVFHVAPGPSVWAAPIIGAVATLSGSCQ